MKIYLNPKLKKICYQLSQSRYCLKSNKTIFKGSKNNAFVTVTVVLASDPDLIRIAKVIHFRKKELSVAFLRVKLSLCPESHLLAADRGMNSLRAHVVEILVILCQCGVHS